MDEKRGAGQTAQPAPTATPIQRVETTEAQPQRYRHKRRTNGAEHGSTRWEALTFFVLLVYTVFAGGQWCATRRQADLADRSLEFNRWSIGLSQRAWVVVADIPTMDLA